MMPVIQLAGLAIPTKPLLLLLAFYVTLWIGGKGVLSLGIDEDVVWNWGVISAISGLIIGRLAYAIRYYNAYVGAPLSILSPRLNAFLPEAFFVGGILVGYLYLRRKHIPIAPFVDGLVPGLLVGWALYALANFLAGDAYGAPTNVPWAVEMWGALRHPAQLYEMVAVLLTIGWLFARPAPRGKGIWGWRLLLAYSLSRLIIEGFRGDSVLLPGGFRLYQILALVGALIALWELSRYAPAAPSVNRESITSVEQG